MKNIIFCFIVFFISCSERNPSNESVINIEPNRGVIGSIDFDSISFIRIESQANRLLGSNLRVKCTETGIYIADFDVHKCVFRYDYNGEFKNTIGKHGKGPNEYIGLIDFIVDSDTIEIFSGVGSSSKITRYTTDGIFVKSSDYNIVASAFAKTGRSYLFATSYGSNQYNHRIIQLDNDGQELKRYLKNKTKIKLSVEEEKFSFSDGKIYFRESFDDNVYLISNNDISVKYHVDFGKYSIPDKFYTTEFYRAFDQLVKNGFMSLYNFFENEHYSVFLYSYQKENQPIEGYHLLYDKNNKSMFDFKFNEMDNKCFNTLIGITTNDELLYVQNAFDIVREREMLASLKIKNYDLLYEVQENDNPIIFVCKIKN